MGIKIGLTGKMRSGKDTVGDFLKKEYGFKTFAFAEGIKFVCGSLGLEPDDNGKPRALYQGVGQDLRKYDPNVWVEYTLRKINKHCTDRDNIVITDVRQPNEVEALQAAGFTIVRIHADDSLRIQRMEAAGDNYCMDDLNHETELAVDTLDTDFTINNNGTIKQLQSLLFSIINLMLDGDSWEVSDWEG